MKPLDNFNTLLQSLSAASSIEVLSESDKEEWLALSQNELAQALKKLLEQPVADYGIVYRWYFRMKWAQALSVTGAESPVTLLEIGSGDGDMIPQLLAKKFQHPETKYLTANMNKKLTGSFKEKTKELPIKIDVIEDAAQNICDYMGDEKISIIAFEHSVNDILQTILAERRGIDTVSSDWYVILPEMIEIIKQEYQNNTLEASVKEEFLDLIKSCLKLLKPDGYIIINHFMYQYDLDLGYEPDLWNNMLPITRKWISTIDGFSETFFEGFDPQWWMFLKKC